MSKNNFDHDKTTKEHSCRTGHPTFGSDRTPVLFLFFYRGGYALDEAVWLDIESEEKLIFRGEEISQRDFARAMRITGTPTFIFLDSKGEIIASQPGFIPEDLYLQILKFVGTDVYLDQSFEEFSEL